MKIGVVFPQTEIGADPGAVQEYAQAVEGMGFSHLTVFDHVLGANLASRPNWTGPYHLDSMFHEPFVLFGFLAGLTTTLELVTGIVILPQRQTALVAKQAAAVDVLSGGRLRLGIGIGWNQVEYEALGLNFHDRGRRSEEQIEVLRALWTQRAVDFKGRWHRISDVGINPMPVQRPIPIWLGGGAEPVVRRVARMADGWMPQFQPDESGWARLNQMRAYAQEYGRDPASIGIDGRLSARLATESKWASLVEGWREMDATHVSVNTMGDGLSGALEHIRRLERFRNVVPD
ncbi:MAG: LLM class F420-dependent oxidoreductase [Candidatus Tectomicrobia bacterium]|nr:LLM class F420-dependent oxidoreductase [Candidatus Tectomicrobia bacterium]